MSPTACAKAQLGTIASHAKRATPDDESSATRLRPRSSCRERAQEGGSLSGVALFEFLDLGLGLLFRVIHGLTDLLAVLSDLFGSGLLVRLMDLLRGVLRVAPCFLRRAFGLIDHSLYWLVFRYQHFLQRSAAP